MTDKEPTKEQIKEFWEWCGLVHIDNPTQVQEATNSCEAMTIDKPVNGWYKPDYSRATSELVSLKETPEPDLNNLFKYAVPKLPDINVNLLVIKFIPTMDKRWGCLIEHLGTTISSVIKDTPALALFWAIWEVIK